MNISLTPELEKYIANKVEGGWYQTASEVIREALRLLRLQEDVQQKKLDELRKDIAIGLAQADRGQTKPFNKLAADRIKVAGRKRLSQQNKAS